MYSNLFLRRMKIEMASLEEQTLVSAQPNENNLHKWKATITGPPETPYEGGIFKFDIELPKNYPFSPPKVTLKTKIFHPNIFQSDICVDFLQDQWSFAMQIQSLLMSILLLLNEPNPRSPLNSEAAELWESNRDEYNKTVIEWVKLYALEK